MRIAILVQTFPPGWIGGTEIATHNIARQLAIRGHEVHVITSLSKNLPRECEENGFFVHRVKTIKKVILFGLSYNLASLPVVRRVNPDIIFCQYVSSGLAGYLAKEFIKKPYVVCGQGSDVYLPWAFKSIISKLVLRGANAIIALTEHMKKEMQKMCDRDMFVIPNGVDLSRFNGLSRVDIRTQLGICNEKVILFVGRLSPIKGLKYLLAAMKIIADRDRNVKLFLVGDGEEREYLKELVRNLNIKQHVTFIGKVPNEKVPEYMVASDIFVLPSLSEGFPVVTLEAMAAGLPIVASRVGGLPEIIKSGENGFLVEPKNPKEIADKLWLLLEDEELRTKMRSNNKEMAKDYSWEKVSENLERVLYYSLLYYNSE